MNRQMCCPAGHKGVLGLPGKPMTPDQAVEHYRLALRALDDAQSIFDAARKAFDEAARDLTDAQASVGIAADAIRDACDRANKGG